LTWNITSSSDQNGYRGTVASGFNKIGGILRASNLNDPPFSKPPCGAGWMWEQKESPSDGVEGIRSLLRAKIVDSNWCWAWREAATTHSAFLLQGTRGSGGTYESTQPFKIYMY